MLVSAVHLTWNCNGVPQNEVTAILLPRDDAKEDEILAPYMDFNAYPKSSAQRAVVFNNVDPMKMGRVQVLFVWQNGIDRTSNRYLGSIINPLCFLIIYSIIARIKNSYIRSILDIRIVIFFRNARRKDAKNHY